MKSNKLPLDLADGYMADDEEGDELAKVINELYLSTTRKEKPEKNQNKKQKTNNTSALPPAHPVTTSAPSSFVSLLYQSYRGGTFSFQSLTPNEVFDAIIKTSNRNSTAHPPITSSTILIPNLNKRR